MEFINGNGWTAFVYCDAVSIVIPGIAVWRTDKYLRDAAIAWLTTHTQVIASGLEDAGLNLYARKVY